MKAKGETESKMDKLGPMTALGPTALHRYLRIRVCSPRTAERGREARWSVSFVVEASMQAAASRLDRVCAAIK